MLSSVRGIILCRLCTKGDRRKYDGDMPMYNKCKRRKRRMYNRKYKRKLKKLSKYSISVHEVDECQNCTLAPAYYVRIYRGKVSPYCKKYTNRIIRKFKGEIKKGNSYRKLFDMWWTIH